MNSTELSELLDLMRDQKRLREQIEVQRVLIEQQSDALKQNDSAARTLLGMGFRCEDGIWIQQAL